ncbi:hypothetical protein NC651_039690 [Populus alba x Populus x berolinensis]|nr:hypothetical protein NC651_039690 [Populus alba x Populus x berolinensis]
MAYIPPHKRHSKDVRGAPPIPETPLPQFQRKMNLRASTSRKDKSGKIVYAEHAISKWFAVGLDDDELFPPYIHLEPISLEYVERKKDSKLERNCSRSPWEIIAEEVQQELLSSFEILRNEMDDQGSERVKPTLLFLLHSSRKLPELGIEFSNFLKHCSDYFDRCQTSFAGAPSSVDIVDTLILEAITAYVKLNSYSPSVHKKSHSMGLESVNKIQVEEAILRQLRRSLHTDIPSSYMENIIDGVVPAIGVDFLEEKDVYTVKVELNQVRQMVIDVSCLDKNLDLRLMLCFRKILTALTDEEMNSVRDLINSAVPDSDMKGGLRWPLGEEASAGGRYSVMGVCHTVTKAYKSSSFRLIARDADGYDFKTGTRETFGEIYLKLKRIVSEIQASSFIG